MYAFFRALIRLITLIVSVLFTINVIAFLLNVFRSDFGDADKTTFTVILIIVFTVIGIILGLIWLKTDGIVRFIIDEPNTEVIEIATSNKSLMRVFVWGFGLFLLVTAIPDIAGTIASHIENSQTREIGFYIDPFLESYVTNGLKIIIGILLFTGIDQLINVKNKAMSFLIKPEPEEETKE